MKKFLLILAVLFSLMSFAGIAGATPFQVGTGGTVEAVALGAGDYSFTSYGSSVFDLGPSDDTGFIHLFDITTTYWAAGTGILNVGIELISPDATPGESGWFIYAAGLGGSTGSIDWGNPVVFDYSYAGMEGGQLMIEMQDISFWQSGTTVEIYGKITNIAAPVPEPATMILLGSGLVGLAGFRRKFKKDFFN